MWNDTVRKQSESSFISGDINSTSTLNQGQFLGKFEFTVEIVSFFFQFTSNHSRENAELVSEGFTSQLPKPVESICSITY